MNNNLIRLICLFHFYLFPLDLLLFFLLVCLAYRESWTLDAWSESLDFRQLDAYTLDALTLDDSTLGAWTLLLDTWTFSIFSDIYFFLIIFYCRDFKHLESSTTDFSQ